MQKMYEAVVNSPKTELIAAITEADTEIEVADSSVLLQPEGIIVIGNGEGAETVKYTSAVGNILKGCIRGFQGSAKPWAAGTRLARNYTAYDHDTFKTNIEQQDIAIRALEDRLDTADSDPVTLQPGLQVINSAKDTRFKLGVIKGKTEINGQGRTGIIGVENPYAIATSGNLFPPFYECKVEPGGMVISPYTYKQPVMPAGWTSTDISVIPNQDYTLSFASVGGVNIGVWEPDESASITEYNATGFTFNSGNRSKVRIIIAGNVAGKIENPMLTLGIEPRPFKPQCKSMLAFQAELHANPTDDSDPDLLIEHNGEYMKLAKWKKVALDGSLPWAFSYTFTGYKQVYLPNFPLNRVNDVGFATKFNGNQLQLLLTTSADESADQFKILTNGNMVINISNTDSGWGDSYVPTPDEIKAYFYGWRMCNAENTQLYSGTGTKCWGKITEPSNTIGSMGWVGYAMNNVPTSPAGIDSGGRVYVPYNLLYRLAKETVEPVVSEGCLTLSEGDNAVEVGTGIVLRESTNPVASGPYYINGNTLPPTQLANKVDDILAVYKNNRIDHTWEVIAHTYESNVKLFGKKQARTDISNYDQFASYSVTYFKLDKSPVVPMTGTLAANEKAQINDLTVGLTEALQRVSVVEEKKAEKDAPGWIAPTLLNGWANIVGSNTPAGYFRDTMGFVHLRGSITGGISTPWTVIFKLPTGYRPKYNNMIPTYTNDSSGAQVLGSLSINNSGDVQIYIGAVGNFSLDGISFLAEQ